MKNYSFFILLFLIVYTATVLYSRNKVKKIPIIARTFRNLKNVDSLQVYSDGHAVIYEHENSGLKSPEMVGDDKRIAIEDSSGTLASREKDQWIIPDTPKLVSFFLKLTVAYYNTEGYEEPTKTTIPTKFH